MAYHANRYDVAVVGGGHNGLTTAALLAKNGRKVIVLERRPFLGGLAAREEFHPGYFSTGLLHDTSGVRRHVIEELNLEHHGLAFSSTPVSMFLPQKSGGGLLLHQESAKSEAELLKHSANDAERYAEYREVYNKLRRRLARLLDQTPPDMGVSSIGGFLQLARNGMAVRGLGRGDMIELLRMLPMCVADWMDEWFESDALKCILAAPAIIGTRMGPRSPATNGMLTRWELLATGEVSGGPASLTDALESVAKSHGAEIRTETDVQRICFNDGAVTGVEFSDGERVHASVVASSCDPKRTFLQLIEPGPLPTELQTRIEHYRCEGSTAKLNFALNAPLRFACRPELDVDHALICNSLVAFEKASDAIKYGRISEAPVLDIYQPSIGNADFAPSGHSVVLILAHAAPYRLQGDWTDEKREALRKLVIRTVNQHAPDFDSSIVGCRVLTPVDIEREYGLTGGHIHHGEHGLDQWVVRPALGCARYRTPLTGLYLCGSGSFPGGGITCAPGANAARIILNDGR